MTDTKNQILAINHAADLILKRKIDSLQIIPAVAFKLLRLTNNDQTNVSDLSQLIETEPTLAAKVLRNVNSAAFALSHKITSIKRAVNILGFSSVRQLALNQLFYHKLIKHQSKKEFDQLFFWQHCLFVASLSRAIAMALKHPDPDLIYCAGLLHDIGKIVFETHGKVSYSDFLVASKGDEQAVIKGEHDFFGLNHAEIGFVLCQQWDIPEQISAIVFCHHELPMDDSPYAKYKADIAIINFANYVAWMQGIGSTSINNPTKLHSEVSKTLNFDKLMLESLLTDVDKEMQHTREFYGIDFPSLNKLRATVIETTLLLNQYQTRDDSKVLPSNSGVHSLTVPHKSLDKNEVVPWTLAAIKADFNFEQLVFLNIKPKQRSLEVGYSYPEIAVNRSQKFAIKIETLPETILNSLRVRKSIIINSKDTKNTEILKQFCVDEFLIAPVLNENRLVALLYLDNYKNKQPIIPHYLPQLIPIIHELGVALTHAKRFELEKKRAELDGLTRLSNKRMVIECLETTFQLNEKKLSQVAVGFIDIDFFKKFNDNCGHQAGDDVLKIVAQIMRRLTRPGDFIGRYGGEEFVFVLFNTTAKGASSYAERIRLEIERKGKILSQRFQGRAVTVSIGVSFYHPKFNTYNHMIEAADVAMYSAKEQGRNRIVIV